MSLTSFEELNLSPSISRAIEEMGFSTPTKIQAESIPLIRDGHDVIGRSQTGTGKTAAFLIPAIEGIDLREGKRLPEVLLLCPTRELAMQARDEARKLCKYMHGIKTVAVYGGEQITRQIMDLRGGANIIIGTPGRVMDHMRRHTLKFSGLKMVILDEADEMLSMGFREDIETILQDVSPEIQTILFSATMPKEIMELTKKYQHDPKLIEIDKKQVTLDKIEQTYYTLPMGMKMEGLSRLLKYSNPKIAIIFCNTKKKVDELCDFINDSGIRAEALHGDMKQSQRTVVMNNFKAGRTAILVATDVAARGIDVDDIDAVINFDIPQNYEYYVHRIGRTGRAGKSGKAFTLCCGRRQVGELLQIAKMTKSVIAEKPMPSIRDIYAYEDEKHTDELEKLIVSEEVMSYTAILETLVKRGYSETAIAAAALETLYGKRVASIEKEEKKQIGVNEKFQKIMINIGKEQRIAPNFIVGAIAERTELAGCDIGKIEIFDNKTIVGIPESQVNHVVDKMQGCKINGLNTITKLYVPIGRESDQRNSNNNSRGGRSNTSRNNFSSSRRQPQKKI